MSGKLGGQRNFGFGKQIEFAAKQALNNYYGEGRYGTKAAHLDRWGVACDWFKTIGIRDARELTRDIILDYGHGLRSLCHEGEIKVSYAQNLISTVNVVLASMRGDRVVWVSPSEVVGKRVRYRIDVPRYLDWSDVNVLQTRLIGNGHSVVAAMVGLARALGLRFKECSLMDARDALKEIKHYNKITVKKGTKGGHARTICVDEAGLNALLFAVAQQADKLSIIPAEMRYEKWRNYAYSAFYRSNGRHFHDFRAAKACELYFLLTGGFTAPVLRTELESGPPPEVEKSVRCEISEYLGHHRPEIVSAYIGPITKSVRKENG